MPLWLEIPLTLAGAVGLWAIGTLVFDGVHWLLHLALASRSRVLQALAWPHAVHHEWLDRSLDIHWENQRKNVFCHLVPEYGTQLAFSGIASLVLPSGLVLACIALQTGMFGFLLSQKGLDINHRPIAILDAYQPSWAALPAYHALHHVYPDAHFSAYTKWVDWVVAGGVQLHGRRAAILGSTPFGDALRDALERAGANLVSLGAEAPRDLDILVLCDPTGPHAEPIEDFIEATRTRQLPPEVWAVRSAAEDPVARHYYRDVRVSYRSLVVPDARRLSREAAQRAVRTSLFFVRRGLHFVPAGAPSRGYAAFRRFRRTPAVVPPGVSTVRTRAERAAAAPA